MVATYILAALYTRATTGLGLRAVELKALACDVATLQERAEARRRQQRQVSYPSEASEQERPAAGRAASLAAERARAAVEKAEAVAGRPCLLLNAAERLSFASAAGGLGVLAFQACGNGLWLHSY